MLILGLILGAGLLAAGMYIYVLRGRAINAEASAQGLRDVIKLFSERTIVAALSDEQFKYLMAHVDQAVFAAIQNMDPERLD